MNQKADWSKAVAGIRSPDDRLAPGSDAAKTNAELIAEMQRKRLSVLDDEDAVTDDFFAERTNRFQYILVLLNKQCVKKICLLFFSQMMGLSGYSVNCYL